jgi:hypothetical protein
MVRSVFVILFAMCVTVLAGAGERVVDHRFAPARQYTLLSFPFDWQKTILLGSGNLGYDFGPGPYHAAGTEIGFSFADTTLPVVDQHFADPAVPIATTTSGTGSSSLTTEAFSIVPASFDIPATFSSGIVRRVGHLAGTSAWANPGPDVDPAFRGVAWGTNRPISYRVRVPAGAAKEVALGVCESYKATPGSRKLELRVEGAPPQIADPMKDGRKNTPYVYLFAGKDANGDGELEIEAHTAPDGSDPNVILNAIWMFPAGTPLDSAAIIRGTMNRAAELTWNCGTEQERIAPVRRSDALTASIRGRNNPAIVITTNRPVSFAPAMGTISLGEGMSILCAPPPEQGSSSPAGTGTRWVFPLPAGTRRASVVVTLGRNGTPPSKFPDLAAEKRKATLFWKHRASLPRNRITIPDSHLQRMLEVNIRNLYQAADLVEGFPVFQPGPTVYRGLFDLDLLLIGRPLMMLGDLAMVRKYIEGTFRYQQADGRLRVVTPFNAYPETPALVSAICRYAFWSGDTSWLRTHWDRVTRGIGWTWEARRSTMTDQTAPNYGLFPPGFVDGGLAGAVPDFSTVTFAMMALDDASRAAAWLGGKAEEERRWRAMKNELMASYVRAARTSIRKDRFGTAYLPVTVGDTSTAAPPQRGQYGFLMALHESEFFSRHDPFLDSIAAGNLRMLDSTLREGMILDAGWTRDAVWGWFSLLHAVTLCWNREYDRALRMIEDVANHAGRLDTWVEEQQIRGRGTHSTGDGANAETSAYFVTAIRHLLLFERPDTTDVLAGIPASWYRPGAVIALDSLPSPRGRVSLRATVSRDGSVLRIVFRRTNDPAGTDRPPVFQLPTAAIRGAGFTRRAGAPVPDRFVWSRGSRVEFEFTRPPQ